MKKRKLLYFGIPIVLVILSLILYRPSYNTEKVYSPDKQYSVYSRYSKGPLYTKYIPAMPGASHYISSCKVIIYDEVEQRIISEKNCMEGEFYPSSRAISFDANHAIIYGEQKIKLPRTIQGIAPNTRVSLSDSGETWIISEHSFEKVNFFKEHTFDFQSVIDQNKIIFKISECTSTVIKNKQGQRYGSYELSFVEKDLHSPEVKAISFYDYNKDGSKDILAIYTYLDTSNNEHYFNKILRTSTGFCYLKEDQYYSEQNKIVATDIASFKENIKKFFSQFTDIRIGKGEKFKNISDYFGNPDTRKDNINVYLTDSLYISEKSIWVSDCNNVNIFGRNNTKIFSLDSTDNVMNIQSCVNLSINNVNIKHAKLGTLKEFSCSGGVIMFYHCSNITIDSCDLNGCGQVGLIDYGSNELISVKNSQIHNCSLAAYKDYNQNLFFEATNETCFVFDNT